jgi:hypothetical protein
LLSTKRFLLTGDGDLRADDELRKLMLERVEIWGVAALLSALEERDSR